MSWKPGQIAISFTPFADRDRDLPAALAERHLQGLGHRQIDAQILELPLAFERIEQPAQIARRQMHVRLGDLDIMQAHGWIELDRHRLDRLAHDLAMDLAGLGHVDDDIAQDLGRAAEPPPRHEPAHPVVIRLDLAEGGEVIRRRDDVVLGEFALGLDDLAAAADAAAAADGIDIDAERAGSLQHRRTKRKPPAPARRGEDDERVVMPSRL